jgi:hypothetical protein
MTIKNTIDDRDLEALLAPIAGQVFVAGHAGYDQARQAWNLAVDQRPSVVVEAESAADVAQPVRCTRARAMRIAPQGTGTAPRRSNRSTARCCCGRRLCGGSTLIRLPAPPAPRPTRCGRT